MKLYVGTTGFSYTDWKGAFYPEQLSQSKMLSYYSERFRTVEINNTLYKIPRASMLEKWAQQVREDFCFALKAPRQITHELKLVRAKGPLNGLFEAASALRGRLGPVLFQLPPHDKMDLDRLSTFLDALPEGERIALEFRHPSWRSEEVSTLLCAYNAACALADHDAQAALPLRPAQEPAATADFGYIRLRKARYNDDALLGWIERIMAQPWERAFVFFKHPKTAARFSALWEDVTSNVARAS